MALASFTNPFDLFGLHTHTTQSVIACCLKGAITHVELASSCILNNHNHLSGAVVKISSSLSHAPYHQSSRGAPCASCLDGPPVGSSFIVLVAGGPGHSVYHSSRLQGLTSIKRPEHKRPSRALTTWETREEEPRRRKGASY